MAIIQRTIIHLPSKPIYHDYYDVYVAPITTDDTNEAKLCQSSVILGNRDEKLHATFKLWWLLAKFKMIGITDGSTVYIITHTCKAGTEVYAYGSTTQKKWILTDSWRIVNTSDAEIQKKLYNRSS